MTLSCVLNQFQTSFLYNLLHAYLCLQFQLVTKDTTVQTVPSHAFLTVAYVNIQMVVVPVRILFLLAYLERLLTM